MMTSSLRRDSSEESLVQINMEDLETYSSDVMTTSQYAQVVFHDVPDIYSFDKDIACKYTLTEGIISEHGDRVGLYKVPFFSAHEYVAFAWAKVKERAEGEKEQEMEVNFRATDLPKEEDFYQFQYIRSDNTVLGASIPFQLKTPVAEEAKEIESDSKSDEEFMVVDKNPASASRRLNDKFTSLAEENKQLQARLNEKEDEYKSLLELSEKLNEDLEKKSESFVRLEKEHESIKMTRSERLTQLETDFVHVLKEKERLEEKLRQSEASKVRLQQQMDESTGDLLEIRQEKSLLVTELNSKIEEQNSMLVALKLSKQQAVEEIQRALLKRDEALKDLKKVKQLIEDERLLREDLQMTMNALAEKHQSTERALALHRQDSDVTILTLDREMARLSRELATKETEVGDLRCQVEELGEKVDAVQTENDSLRTQLTGVTRERDECFNRNNELQQTIRRLRMRIEERAAKDEETPLVNSVTPETNARDYHYMYEKSQSRISQLEERLNEFEVELRQSDMMNAASVKQLKEELDDFRSNVNSIYGSSGASSTRNLDSQVILDALEASGQEVRAPEVDEVRVAVEASRVPVVAQPTGMQQIPLDLTRDAAEPKHIRNVEDEPRNSVREKSPFLERAQNTFFNLLPQIPGTVFRTTIPGRVISTSTDTTPAPSNTEANEASNEASDEASTAQFDFEEDTSDFSDLVAWARSNVYNNPGKQIGAPQADVAPPTFEEATASAEVAKTTPLLAPPTETPPMTEEVAPLTLDDTSLPTADVATPTEHVAPPTEHVAPPTADVAPPTSTEASAPIPPPEDPTPQVFTLTDDGRILDIPDEEEEHLECPVCDFRVGKNKYRELEFHVESHLATSLVCPVCSQNYPLGDQNGFERHVQRHFTGGLDFDMLDEDEDDEVVFRESTPEQQQPQQQPQQPNPRRWFLDID